MKYVKVKVDSATGDKGDKIFFQNITFWISYSPGSGIAVPVRSTYITDKQGDKNQDNSLTKGLVNYANNHTPLKKKGNLSVFEVPVYSKQDTAVEKFDIWGGNIKPIKNRYIVVSQGKINVITFFDSKNEALAWLKYSA